MGSLASLLHLGCPGRTAGITALLWQLREANLQLPEQEMSTGSPSYTPEHPAGLELLPTLPTASKCNLAELQETK